VVHRLERDLFIVGAGKSEKQCLSSENTNGRSIFFKGFGSSKFRRSILYYLGMTVNFEPSKENWHHAYKFVREKLLNTLNLERTLSTVYRKTPIF
jgi:hypothetical protein